MEIALLSNEIGSRPLAYTARSGQEDCPLPRYHYTMLFVKFCLTFVSGFAFQR